MLNLPTFSKAHPNERVPGWWVVTILHGPPFGGSYTVGVPETTSSSPTPLDPERFAAARELLEAWTANMRDLADVPTRERYFAALRAYAAIRGPQPGDRVQVRAGLSKTWGYPLADVVSRGEKTALVRLLADGSEKRVPLGGLRLGSAELTTAAGEDLDHPAAVLVVEDELAEEGPAGDGELEEEGPRHYLGDGLLPACGSPAAGGYTATPVRGDVSCPACLELLELELPRAVIIPCGGKKLDRPAPAAELYVGSYFVAALAAARALVDGDDSRIRVLSGRYGFVPLDRVLEPYSQRIDELGAVTAGELARQAGEDELLAEIRDGRRPALVLAGAAYAYRAADALDERIVWPWPLATARGIGDHLRYFVALAAQEVEDVRPAIEQGGFGVGDRVVFDWPADPGEIRGALSEIGDDGLVEVRADSGRIYVVPFADVRHLRRLEAIAETAELADALGCEEVRRDG